MFRTDVLPSLAGLGTGYLLAVALGVAGGTLIGLFPLLRALAEPTLEFFRTVPPPVLVPVIALFAGYTGSLSKIIIITLGCVWPVLLNAVEGVRAVDEVLLDTARCYHLRRRTVLLHVIVRGASPQTAAGARQALSIAVILMVISELFGANHGLGAAGVQFRRSFAIPQMWTASSSSACSASCCPPPSASSSTTRWPGAGACATPTEEHEPSTTPRCSESPAPAGMAVVFQEYGRSLFPWMTVRQNVERPLIEKRTGRAERQRLVDDALEAVGLTDSAHAHPWQLSGGMQQRVAIARPSAAIPVPPPAETTRRSTVPPLHDVAHLAHIELRSPRPQDTVDFFTRYLGMNRSGSAADSVFLRAFDDYETVTLAVTAHHTSGVGRTNLRASSPEALQRRVSAIEAVGGGVGWAEGDPGYGPTYVFRDPDGHEFGLYYESEWYTPGPGEVPALKNQATSTPDHGVGVRRLDHVNYLAVDVERNREFLRDTLGAMVTEQIVMRDGSVSGCWTTFTNKGYDAVYTRDWTQTPGRLHHLAFAVDSRADILRAADIAIEHGIYIETGPHKHAIQQTFFLYVYEPGGNRIELCNAGARLVLAPDWRPVNWSEADRAKGQAWGLATIESFHTHGTPPVEAAP